MNAYLSNGQSCYVQEQIGSKYIVRKIFEVDGDYGIEEVEGDEVVVDKVFDKPPVEKIDAEIKELQKIKSDTLSEISELENRKRTLKREVDQITQTQISEQKFIVNRNDLLKAKSIVLFPKDSIMPMHRDVSNIYRSEYKIYLQVSVGDGEVQSWGYKIEAGREGISHWLCPKNGLLIDPTQEEVDAVIMERAKSGTFPDYVIKNTPDNYLTSEQLERKTNMLAMDKENEKRRLNDELNKITEKLKNYE